MAAKRAPKSFVDTIRVSELPEQLAALRDRLASALEAAEPREMAPLARQLNVVLQQIAQIKPPEVSRVDEIAKKRDARRRAAAEVPDSPGVQNVDR